MQELHIFKRLKSAILKKFQEAYPYWQQPIQEFKGREIARLQQLLLEKVGGRISEKWFYTHIKPYENEKLPRQDMLDLLSQFVEYEDWPNFVESHQKAMPKSSEQRKNKTWIFVLGGIAIVSFLAFAFGFQDVFKKDYRVCFVDADLGTPLKNASIELHILKENQSPLVGHADEEGCYVFENTGSEITFFVEAAYYQKDTFHRKVYEQSAAEIIQLKTDDYAMMIHLFSNSKIKDWKKRRAQLDQMIADDAIIIQVSKDRGIGMEMYNKSEFINKLTIPVSGLKNLKILATEYNAEDQIFRLRFIQEMGQE